MLLPRCSSLTTTIPRGTFTTRLPAGGPTPLSPSDVSVAGHAVPFAGLPELVPRAVLVALEPWKSSAISLQLS